jgi:drug/metabolite transporter (DMT)-like permease
VLVCPSSPASKRRTIAPTARCVAERAGMEWHIFLAVIAAAACHAGWNALLKLRVEPIVAIALISVACGLVALPLLPFSGIPRAEAWPYVLASLALHLVYYLALAEAYRHGDLGQVYPIARGSAPLLTAIGATAVAAEPLAPLAWCGVVVLAGGILLLSLAGGRSLGAIDRRSVGFALLTAASISAYTLVDGIGARLSDSAVPYIVWLLLLDGLMMLAFGVWLRGRAFVRIFGENWRLVLAGGVMSSVSYGIAIWAMTVAPIAMVAALRETSVLFAVLISVVWLGEPVRRARIAAVALALSGVVLMRLS